MRTPTKHAGRLLARAALPGSCLDPSVSAVIAAMTTLSSALPIEVILFDVVGTLVDEDTAWLRVAERVCTLAGLNAAHQLRASWSALLSERISAIASGEAAWRPHRQLVIETAREAITRAGGVATPETIVAASCLDREYLAWPDVAEATATLRRDRIVASVSNGDLDSLARLSNRNSISWDLALSTASVHTFKPAGAAYQYAIDTLDVDPTRTLFVSSHPWDLRAASDHQFRTAYVARPGAKRPSLQDRFDLTLTDLSCLPEQLNE